MASYMVASSSVMILVISSLTIIDKITITFHHSHLHEATPVYELASFSDILK